MIIVVVECWNSYVILYEVYYHARHTGENFSKDGKKWKEIMEEKVRSCILLSYFPLAFSAPSASLSFRTTIEEILNRWYWHNFSLFYKDAIFSRFSTVSEWCKQTWRCLHRFLKDFFVLVGVIFSYNFLCVCTSRFVNPAERRRRKETVKKEERERKWIIIIIWRLAHTHMKGGTNNMQIFAWKWRLLNTRFFCLVCYFPWLTGFTRLFNKTAISWKGTELFLLSKLFLFYISTINGQIII